MSTNYQPELPEDHAARNFSRDSNPRSMSPWQTRNSLDESVCPMIALGIPAAANRAQSAYASLDFTSKM